MDKKISSETTDRILSEMVDYTGFHFAFEEDYMKKINYPDLKKHHYQHEFFTKNLIGKLEEERAGGLVLSSEVMRMMMNWLQDHILQEDMKYSPE
jgi:hemerythrin-like metal-binding protein